MISSNPQTFTHSTSLISRVLLNKTKQISFELWQQFDDLDATGEIQDDGDEIDTRANANDTNDEDNLVDELHNASQNDYFNIKDFYEGIVKICVNITRIYLFQMETFCFRTVFLYTA